MEEYTEEQRSRLQKAFGYTYEQYRTSIRNMALNGAESIGAMGVDTPLAVFSKQNRPLFDYFKQAFMLEKTETFWSRFRRTARY